MAYVTRDYYNDTFKGTYVPYDEFDRLAELASDVIDAIIARPIPETVDQDKLAKATAYQLETLFKQGGIGAVTGFAASQQIKSEKLDDYSITEQMADSASQNVKSINGIPVSPVALSILRSLGLTSRWLYTGRREKDGRIPCMPSLRNHL